jgi:hypothetical protein
VTYCLSCWLPFVSPLQESSKNDFERGSCCCFELDAGVGELQALRIGHDNSGLGPSWHLQVRCACLESAGRAECVHATARCPVQMPDRVEAVVKQP